MICLGLTTSTVQLTQGHQHAGRNNRCPGPMLAIYQNRQCLPVEPKPEVADADWVGFRSAFVTFPAVGKLDAEMPVRAAATVKHSDAMTLALLRLCVLFEMVRDSGSRVFAYTH